MQTEEAQISQSIQTYVDREVLDQPAFGKDMQTAAKISLSNEAYVHREIPDQPAFGKDMQTDQPEKLVICAQSPRSARVWQGYAESGG